MTASSESAPAPAPEQDGIATDFSLVAVGAVPKAREYRPFEDPFKGNSKYNMLARYIALKHRVRLLEDRLAEKDSLFAAKEAALIKAQARISALEELAYHDSLTGLYNRRALEDRLHLALQHSRSINPDDDETGILERTDREVALGFIDLDGFKRLNDTHGHAVGDQALVTVANFLSKALRSSDDIVVTPDDKLDEPIPADAVETEKTVARPHGDEFVLVLPHTNAKKMAARARVIEDGLNKLVIEGTNIPIRGSLGIVSCDLNLSAGENLRLADAAMYKRKQERKAEQVSEVPTASPIEPRPV